MSEPVQIERVRGEPGPAQASPAFPRAWQDALATGLAIRAQFVLTGNLRDAVPVAGPTGHGFVPLEEALWQILAGQGIEALLVHDPVDGLRLHGPCPAAAQVELERAGVVFGREAAAPEAVEAMLRRVAELGELPVAVMLDYASHLGGNGAHLPERLLITVDKLCRQPPPRPARGPGQPAPPRNPILWVLDRPGDLPDWFAVGNHTLSVVTVPLPDLEDRFAFAQGLAPRFPDSGALAPEERRAAVEKFALQTEGLALDEMRAVAELARIQHLGIERADEALRSFRTGVRRNPWTSPLLRERLKRGQEILSRRVKGQEHAIARTLDILVRSVTGLSGAQSSSRLNRPRGVLFFAGPTGVGKTELAKAVTELLFGDETTCHRFDMTEFNSERSVSRLVGAPPGYAGHEFGGELTNAVRSRPFSVVLFDEVEKAHPRVLDMFLQILDEGRLTDSRGETAYFSESVIIFTSNLGMFGKDTSTNMGMEILPSDSYEHLESKLLAGVRNHFRYELRRPELMNRIGQNIVVFDFIHPRSAELIFAAIVERVLQTVLAEHGTEVRLTAPALRALADLCINDYFDGGRGIGNRMEVHFINPLARILFDAADRRRIEIQGVDRSEGTTRLIHD